MRLFLLPAVFYAAVVAPACSQPKPAPTTAAAPSSPSNEAPVSIEKWQTRSETPSCYNSLASLAQGELQSFSGIGKCGRVDAEKALGSSGDQPSKFEQFGEYRVYKVAKESLLVWFLSDDIRIIQLLYPKLGKPVRAVLGEPQARIQSQLSHEWEQWIYASRGVTLHVRKGNAEPVVLFAYAPSTVEEFLKSDVARVARTEAPVEELR